MRKKIIVTAFLIFLMILVPGVFGKSFIGDIEATQEYLITKYYSFQEVNEDGILQYFTPQYNYLKSIELFIVNLSPDMEGDLELSLSDTEGNVIYYEIYDIASITPGEFRNYEIFKKVIPGEQYILHLSYRLWYRKEGKIFWKQKKCTWGKNCRISIWRLRIITV